MQIGRLLHRWRYAPFLVQLTVTRRCNLACSYCNEFDQSSAPVPLATLKRRLEQIKRLGAWAVEFTGGEPLLNPELFDAIAYARRLSLAKVMLISNAYRLKAEQIRRLNEAGLQELQVSVDGLTPSASSKKVLSILRPNLERLARQARFRVVLSGVLGSAPLEEVLAVITFAKQHNFLARVLVLHDARGQMLHGAQGLAAYNQVMRALGQRFSEARDYRRQLLQTGAAPFKCRAGSRYLYVDEHGQVSWCSQTRDQFQLPLEAYDHEQLKRQFYTYKRCNASCTIGCARTCSAYDSWRAQQGC